MSTVPCVCYITYNGLSCGYNFPSSGSVVGTIYFLYYFSSFPVRSMLWFGWSGKHVRENNTSAYLGNNKNNSVDLPNF